MRRVARFDGEAKIRALHRHVGHHAVVRDIQNVAARFADDGRDLGEPARLILDLHDQLQDAALAHHFAQDDVRQKAHVDIAAGQNNADFPALEQIGI